MIIYLPYELAYFIVEYIMNGFLYLHFLYPLGLRQLSESKKLFRYKTLSIIEVSMLNFGYLYIFHHEISDSKLCAVISI